LGKKKKSERVPRVGKLIQGGNAMRRYRWRIPGKRKFPSRPFSGRLTELEKNSFQKRLVQITRGQAGKEVPERRGADLQGKFREGPGIRREQAWPRGKNHKGGGAPRACPKARFWEKSFWRGKRKQKLSRKGEKIDRRRGPKDVKAGMGPSMGEFFT